MSESFTQQQASNLPDLDQDEDMLEDVELEELEDPTNTRKADSKKRKGKERSDIWVEFTKLFVEVGDPPRKVQKGKCKRCDSLIAADPNLNGTTAMWKHLNSCRKKQEQKSTQTMLNQGGSGVLLSWRFNQERIRLALCKMIIIDELSFRFVERQGFIEFCREAQPLFKIPTRHTIRADCVKLFLEHKDKMKTFFKSRGIGRVSITSDCWTAINNTNFICVTAHCIDREWRLHKRVIGFAKITSHKGEDLAYAITSTLAEWGLQKLFCCTMDNASSNDVAIRHMKRTFVERNIVHANGQYLHLRCVAHIVNLVVEEGLQEIGMSVRRVREAVKWIKASPGRAESFKNTAKLSDIETSKFLCLDVPTRWNSTYLMLESALPYAPAMKVFERVNRDFAKDLEEKQYNNLTIGVPEDRDWREVKRMCSYLKKFEKLTRQVSGTAYVTIHTFFVEMVSIYTTIRRLVNHADNDVKNMATKMKSKFEKYWLEEKELNPRMNKIIYIAAILDPRQKMKHVQSCLKLMYGDDRSTKLVEELNETMYDLFELYQKERNDKLAQVTQPSRSLIATSSIAAPTNDGEESDDGEEEAFNSWVSSLVVVDEDDEDVPDRSEINLYLSEKQYKMTPDEQNDNSFNILEWWRSVRARYPVLAEMARDVMAIPVSSVASESAFSTGGRVLSRFRSSLSPNVVKKLICTEDWLRCDWRDKCLEDEEDVPETVMEQEFDEGKC